MKKPTIHLMIVTLLVCITGACHRSIIPNLPITPEPENPPPAETLPDSINNPPVNREQRIEWLRDHAMPIQTINPDDVDDTDLENLKYAIGDSKIVLLGEQFHNILGEHYFGEGSTYLAKVRLIKYLYEEMGFNILAFQASFYDCQKAWSFIQNGVDPYQAFRGAIPEYWSQTRELESLIELLQQSSLSEAPLQLAGLDCRFGTSSSVQGSYLSDLNELLREINSDLTQDPAWFMVQIILADLVSNRYVYGEDPNYGLQLMFFQFVDRMKLDIELSDLEQEGKSFWVQTLLNVKTLAELDWSDGPSKWFGFWRPEYFNLRSRQMYDNLTWLLENTNENTKIIVWADAQHIGRNLPSLVSSMGSTLNKGYYNMADHLWQEYGAHVFNIIFTAYEGLITTHLPLGGVDELHPVYQNDLEELLFTAEFTNAFLNLRALPPYRDLNNPRLLSDNAAWIKTDLVAKPYGEVRMKGDWTRIVDGIFFIREMNPSTLSSK